MRKIAVIGSRHFNNYVRLERVLQHWLPVHIVSGGTGGADALAERLAREHGLPITVIKPDWKRFGRRAGPIRKRTIVDTVDLVIAFWDGKSRGTASALNYARAKGKIVIVETVGDARPD